MFKSLKLAFFTPFIFLICLEVKALSIEPDEDYYMLPALLEKVLEFKNISGRNPTSWVELNPKIACGGFYPTDPGLSPTLKDQTWWQPKNCKLNYGFASKEFSEFILVAKDSGGEIKFGIGLDKKVIKIKSRTSINSF